MKVAVFVLFGIVIAIKAQERESPAVLISILVRNKAHVLPYTLSFVENLNYPKNRLGLFIRSDHNVDNSVQIIDAWLNTTQSAYHTVNKKYKLVNDKRRTEKSESDWPYERLTHVINMKEEALNFARKNWYDFVLFLDADVLLSNPDVLKNLIALDLAVVAPMVSTTEKEYTNFWTELGPENEKILDKEIQNYDKKGHFKVDGVSNVVLVNLNLLNSDGLTFDKKVLNTLNNKKGFYYEGVLDPDVIFSVSAKQANVPIYVANDHFYGFVLHPLAPKDTLEKEKQSLVNVLVEILDKSATKTVDVKECFKNFMTYPKPDTLGMDRIFVVNHDTDLKNRFELLSRFMGLSVQRVPLIDEKSLTLQFIEEHGISQLPDYKHPVEKRPMTLFEIRWFLSHHEIWQKMVKKSLNLVLVMEDDVRFKPDFKKNVLKAVDEAKNTGKNWDLLYFTRKWIGGDELRVDGTKNLYETAYSPSTTAYCLTLEGAKKLLNASPLSKMVPVQEFLPIMANKHPNKTWNEAFSERNLVAWHVYPSLAETLKD
ncbi:glycosyltransferase 25 family member-like [Culicoides brevitarsis]|uniref:glycosyltransferase 25 family member-like n=1 Tax=Culicoides brevitarsis TaxID=469753 RepID=UPI00307B8D64